MKTDGRYIERSPSNRDSALFSRVNNFNLLRLLAAMQVMFFHTIHQLRVQSPGWLSGVLNFVENFFPGVPIFFVISGFLITMSYERTRYDLRVYLYNRALRLYPALYVCFGITMILLVSAGFLTKEILLSLKFWLWTIGQLSFVQFYNPAEFRSFGVGVVNGPLGTISTEINFYVLLPLLYWVFRLEKRSVSFRNIVFLILGAISFGFIILYMKAPAAPSGTFSWVKLLYVSVIPHLWLFLFGVSLYKNWSFCAPFIKGKLLIWFPVYIALCTLVHVTKPEGVLYYFLLLLHRCVLAVMIISAALTREELTTRWLHDVDLSYGVYIYHMLVVNIFVFLGLKGRFIFATLVFVIAFALASLSWRFVESPALARKKTFVAPNLSAAR
ncbi:MAG: acyltransferase [Verrucomicrobiota bacterium]